MSSSAGSNALADLWASSLASLLSLTASGQVQLQIQQQNHQNQQTSSLPSPLTSALQRPPNAQQQSSPLLNNSFTNSTHITNNDLNNTNNTNNNNINNLSNINDNTSTPTNGRNLTSNSHQQHQLPTNLWAPNPAGALCSVTELMFLAQQLSNSQHSQAAINAAHYQSATNHQNNRQQQHHQHQLAQQILQNQINLNLNLNQHHHQNLSNTTHSSHDHLNRAHHLNACAPLNCQALGSINSNALSGASGSISPATSSPFDPSSSSAAAAAAVQQLVQSMDVAAAAAAAGNLLLNTNNSNSKLICNSPVNYHHHQNTQLNTNINNNSNHNNIIMNSSNNNTNSINLNNNNNTNNINNQTTLIQCNLQPQAPSVPSSSLLAKLTAVTSRPNAHLKSLRLDDKMIDLLEAFFAINYNPEPAAIEMIAKRINSSADLVAEWFECKRIKLNGISANGQAIPNGLDGTSDASPRSEPNRKRAGGRVVTFSEYQRSLLEAIFDENNYLHPQEYEELSNLIEVPARNIKIWFKNRRSKQRLSGRISGA